jgi:DNA-binding MltR family transcriptional regulator
MPKMARSASRKLLDKLPSTEEMAAAMSSLKQMDDTAAALIGSAYLDHALELLLKAHFQRPSAPFFAPTEAHQRLLSQLFDGAQNGILGTFSSKIRIAYALGLIPDEAYADLLLISGIRNNFAHSLHRDVSFANPHVVADCGKLKYLDYRARFSGGSPPAEQPAPRLRFMQTVQAIYAEFKRTYDARDAFIAAFNQAALEWDKRAQSVPSGS